MKRPATIIVLGLLMLVSIAHANPVKERFEAATIAFSERRFEESIKLYEETLEIYPKLAPAYFFMGLAHLELGTPPSEVMWLFEKTIEIDPTYTRAYEQMGKMTYGQGDFAKAEEYCSRAVELDPTNISAKLTLAWTYLLGQSRPDEARELFESVIESHDASYAYLGLGMAYFMMDERAKVLDIITQLKQKDHNDLAEQLEMMVRQGRSTRPQQMGTPLFAPRRQKSELVRDEAPSAMPALSGNQAVEKMPVRLSGSLPGANVSADQPPSTGAERIQALRRSQRYSKGSGY